MGHQIVIAIMYTVLTLFFIGLIGCAFVVILSWIDILREGFTKDTLENDSGHGGNSQHAAGQAGGHAASQAAAQGD